MQNTGNCTLVTVSLEDRHDGVCWEFLSAQPMPDYVDDPGGRAGWNNLGPLGGGEAAVVHLYMHALTTCEGSVNRAWVEAETGSGTPATGDGEVTVTIGEPHTRVFMPLIMRGRRP